MKNKCILILLTIVLSVIFMPKVNSQVKAPIDITKMDIEQLNTALEKEIITSEQLVKIYLERIEAYDYAYNSINQINENAIEEAMELDKERQEGKVRGKLHGIPLVVKTNIDVKGLATTAGAKALEDNFPKEDAEVIKKLKKEGAIILASTNMSEFAFQASSSSSSYGTVKNAYNTLYSAYGSSGGTAVAVALSFATAGLGTDTNSSIRVPASANNIYGFRASYGLIDMEGILPYDIYRDVVGPMAKNTIDLAIIMDAIASNSITENYIEATKISSLKGKRIGVIKEFYSGSNFESLKVNKKTYDGIKELMDIQIEKLKSAGAKIIYIDDFLDKTYYDIIFNTMSGFTFCDAFNEYIKNSPSKIKNFNALANSSKKIYNLDGYKNSCGKSEEKYTTTTEARKQKYLYYVGETMDKNNVDVLLYPTVKNKLQKASSSDEGSLITPSTYISSTTGLPAVSVPIGFYEGLPYGMEFLSGPEEEALLFEIISSYEKLNDFNKLPDAAPLLYEIDEVVTELTNNYLELDNKDISIFLKLKERKIKKKIIEFFSNYSDESNEKINEKAKELNEKINNLNSSNERISTILKIIIISLITIILLYLIIKINKIIKKRKKFKK